MSLFKKSNRKSKNQRTRVDDSDEDNCHSIESDLSRISNKNNFNKFESINDNSNNNNFDKDFDDIYDNKSKNKSNPKLSFDVEDEDCDVFKVKKSSYSRRMAKHSTDNRKKKKDVKKEVVNEENNRVVDENSDKNTDDLNVIWIKSEELKEIKSEPKEEMNILTGDEINEDLEGEYEAEEYKSNEPFHHFRGALERGVIPDAKTIYELKKQRQMARDIEELIIPLDDDQKYEESDSRIVREDDNDKSDDDDEEEDQRISFAINRDNIDREKAKEAFLMAQEENEDQSSQESESEDELDRWEREQIKKGVRMPVSQMLTQEQASNRAICGLFADNFNVVDMDIDRPFSRPKKANSIPSKVLNRTKSSVTIEDIIERVKNRIKVFNESIESKERQIVSLRVDMNESKNQIERLSKRREELLNPSTTDQ